MSDFASRLLHARATAGMTQRDLALIANISAVQLSRYEGGKSTPRPAVLMQLAKALGVSKEWLESGHDAASDDAHSITVTSTQQGPDSYEVTFKIDSVTAAAIEDSARVEGIEPGAFLKRLVLHQMRKNILDHPTLSRREIESIAVEVKLLMDADKKPAPKKPSP